MKFTDPDPDLDGFYGDLAGADLQPLWRQVGLLPHSPRTISPHLWRWKDVKALAERSGTLIPVDKGGDRRVLSLSHPHLHGKPFATPTLWAGIQYLNPRESAPPHRHSPAALRFVMEGTGVWTLVNGDPILMEPGDLVLTPSYNWHAHDNPGDEPMVWFDGLDLPMVQSLDAVFFEDGPDDLEPYERRPSSRSESFFASSGLRPAPTLPTGHLHDLAVHSPLLRYRWEATDHALAQHMLESDDGFVHLRYTDPTTGGDVMPTLRAEMVRVGEGRTTLRERKVGSSVVLVHNGSGNSRVGDAEFRWEPGDIFVVPSWSAVEHHAREQADLFVLSDTPVIEKIGLARTDRFVGRGS